MSDKDGGWKDYPLADPEGDWHDKTLTSVPAMALRDWFAGQVLAGMHARDSYDKGLATPRQRAAIAYKDADAMLAARGKP